MNEQNSDINKQEINILRYDGSVRLNSQCLTWNNMEKNLFEKIM